MERQRCPLCAGACCRVFWQAGRHWRKRGRSMRRTSMLSWYIPFSTMLFFFFFFFLYFPFCILRWARWLEWFILWLPMGNENEGEGVISGDDIYFHDVYRCRSSSSYNRCSHTDRLTCNESTIFWSNFSFLFVSILHCIVPHKVILRIKLDNTK